MGQTREQRIVKQLSDGAVQKQTAIATDMFLPNHSGVAHKAESKRSNDIRYAKYFSSIQAAIDDLPSDGGIVVIPAGIHNITTPLTLGNDITLVGAGISATQIRGNIAGDYLIKSTDANTRYYRWNISDMYLSNFGGGGCINMKNITSSVIRDLKLNIDDIGINLDGTLGCYYNVIENVDFRGGNVGLNFEIYANENKVNACSFNGCTTAIATDADADNNHFIGTTVENATNGMLLDGENATVVATRMEQVSSKSIEFGTTSYKSIVVGCFLPSAPAISDLSGQAIIINASNIKTPTLEVTGASTLTGNTTVADGWTLTWDQNDFIGVMTCSESLLELKHNGFGLEVTGEDGDIYLNSTTRVGGSLLLQTSAPDVQFTSSTGDDYIIDVGTTASVFRIRNSTDSRNDIYINGTGNIAMSTNYTAQTLNKLYVQDRVTDANPSGNFAALSSTMEYFPSATTTTQDNNLHGYEGGITVYGSSGSISGGGAHFGLRGNCTNLLGASTTISNTGTGLFASCTAAQLSGTGGTLTQGNAMGTFLSCGANTTITTAAHIRIGTSSNSGTITTLYGIYIPAITAGTNNYEIWLDTDAQINFRASTQRIYSAAASTLNIEAATIKLGVATTNVVDFVAGDGATAPGTKLTPTFTSYYGGNTKALGDPVEWIDIKVNGTARKIPVY